MVFPNELDRAVRLALALGLAVSLGACSDDDENNNNDDPNNVVADAGADADNMDAGMTDDMGGGEEDMGGGEEDMGGGEEDMGGGEEDMGGGEDMGMAFDGFLIFDEGLENGATFAEFGGSTNSISETTTEAFSGTTSLQVSVPAAGYTGGAYVPPNPVDLSQYNALSFYVKASQDATLNVAGFGNTSDDTTQQVELPAIPLTTSWQQVVIPIPDPSIFTANSGLFHFAEGAEEGAYDIFFDEIAFVSVDPTEFTNASAALATVTADIVTGQTTTPVGTVYNVEISGTATTLPITPFWFSWTSSDDTVATVDANGVVTAVAAGSTTITGTLAGDAAGGQLDVNVIEGPTAAAPTPQTAAADVEVSLFSNAYTNSNVTTFRAGFSAASLTELAIAGDDVLLYGSLDFVGIEMIGADSVDISGATTMHIDIWSPNANLFGIKLVDFGGDNAFGGGDDTEAQIDFTAPDITTNQWVSLDIPLADFASGGLANRANLSQIILVGRTDDGQGGFVPGNATVFVDNIYFY